MKYQRLFSPITINGMTARNRIVAAATGDLFEEKAFGGAGIVICGHTIVDPGRSSFASPDEPYLFHKYAVEEAQSRIRRCHAGGAKASLELFHAGQYARVKEYALGPMGFVREDGITVKAMDEADMDEAAERFAQAALDAKLLGFDMVFLHFGHGWLPSQFLSPLFNQRTDEYGGCIENRVKFPLHIIKKVREAVGANFPVDMRVSAIEWVPGGIEFEDTLHFVRLASQYVDTVQISAGLDINHEGNVHMVTTNFKPHMVNAEYARQVSAAVDIPISVVGAVLDPDMAESLLAEGNVDLVAFGRSFLADPDWPNKAKDDCEEDIRPCIRCLQCYHISTNRRNVGCSVNPRFTNEEFLPKDPALADHKKNVMVIGGGPGGITAACTAAKRGHHVTLLEQGEHLGGALNLVTKEHYKEDIRRYYSYLMKQMKKSSVCLKLKTTATPELVKKLQPDVLILAFGAKPWRPNVPGEERPFVIDYEQALSQPECIGQNVVIIGGGTIGAELALELAEIRGKQVYLVEPTREIAAAGNMLFRIALRQKMDMLPGLHRLTSTSCESIEDSGVTLNQAGEKRFIEADTVIFATGLRSDAEAVRSFYGITPDTFTIGDCIRPRKIQEAVFEGYAIASHI